MVNGNEILLSVNFEYKDAIPLTASFSNSMLAAPVIQSLVEGFAQLAGGYSRNSAIAFLTSTRRLIAYLELNPQMVAGDVFAPNMLPAYRAAIAEDFSLQTTSKNTTLNCAIRLMKWVHRNRPKVVPYGVCTKGLRFPDENGVNLPHFLSEEELKSILRACQEDIDFYWQKFLDGQRILAGDVKDAGERELSEVINTILNCGGGIFPTQAQLQKIQKNTPNLMRRINNLGGLLALRQYCFATLASLVPYYISIVAQTAGNADAILLMSRNTLIDHEIFETSKFVTWEKRRGLRTQRREFDTRKRYAPPNLIDDIMKMTDRFVALAPSIHKDRLFLHQGFSIPSLMSRQSLHNYLKDFIEKHALPDFDPSDLRRTSADLHERVGGKHVAQKVLNHAKVSTTEIYVDKNRKRQEHDKLIHRFQGELLKKVSGITDEGTVLRQYRSEVNTTTFGFDCKDPFSGIAPGSVQGKLCDKFQMCATCPGAIIVLDDANVVARLLKTKQHLTGFSDIAQQRGWGERFEAVYRPSLNILEKITAKIDRNILCKAEQLLPQIPPLPDLE